MDVTAISRMLPATFDGARGPAALFALLAEQLGVASTAQARALGVSRRVERRLVRDGALTDVLPGVLATNGTPRSFVSMAMAAALSPGVVAVSHGAAARLHGLAGFGGHPTIDVIGGRGSHLPAADPLVRHYSRGPVRDHVVAVGPVPVTSIPLTLALLAPVTRRRAMAAALADALGRGVDETAIRAVAEAWRRPGRSGPGVVLSLLDRLGAADAVA